MRQGEDVFPAAVGLAGQCRVVFGKGAPPPELAADLRVAIPVLAGPRLEVLPAPRLAGGAAAGLRVGFEQIDVAEGGLDAASEALYRRLLARAGDDHLCRIWNYVPAINAEVGGLENYRAFCRGRSLAFERAWGAGFTRRLPAASALGGPCGQLTAIFVASPDEPEPVENPEQVPAYEYPVDHGPRSPSFSRATRLAGPAEEWVFVSGTAAVKGHATIAPDHLGEQIACTLDNLALIGTASGVGRDLGRGAGWTRQFKVYLRHAADLAEARAALEGPLLDARDQVIWLESDICRAALRIEIEATLQRLPTK